MENKDNKKRFTKFLKKQGFYIALFTCLAVVAVVAAINTSRKGNIKAVAKNEAVTTKEKINENEKNNSQETNEKSLSEKNKKINNAVEVRNNSQKKEKIGANEVSVSKTTNVKFAKPVEGKVIMKYSETPIWWEISKSYRPNFGINIESKVGSSVNAIASGEVKKIDKDGSFGTTVSIYHPENGKTSVYGNLDKKLKIKEGDKIQQGQQIGKVGKTSLRGMSKDVGNNFLHLEILKKSDGDPQFSSENPEKYIKY